MTTHLRTLAPVLAVLFLAAGAQRSDAQIINEIKAHIDHSFVIGDKTLPPGDYMFRMTADPAQSIMIATNQHGTNVAEFLVRQSIADHRPSHSELVFHKYGDAEFLSKVFQSGSKNGVSVMETSKQEARLASQDQQPFEHTEEQK